VAGVVVFVREEDFGVAAASGIFGGLVVPLGKKGLAVVGVPRVFGVGVVTPPGVVGVTGAAAVGAGTCASVMITGRARWGPSLLSAAYAAAAAPTARSAVAPITVAAERQLGVCVPRLPGAPAPHCRHQS